ncbi:hypothetical protein [Fimbriiglobus ruber]|uniref:Uncharacterized protein n=1 Tax=Fimbriiglobus ruber TaxID=1908690 RepID=A0A225DKZ7_9BACT|nr:hypothetical protein [Fimbriiglobus ruber]OWK36989.1 hypothetical protein FRUB_07911 [Fimbriiglobus ruber]OWK42082.1 hypothetical protein FRUB_04160 [Fimbriiglobus ruber]
MAEVLPHPDMDRDFSQFPFSFADGYVDIRTRNGEPLTPAMGVYLLELAKQILLNEALEG